MFSIHQRHGGSMRYDTDDARPVAPTRAAIHAFLARHSQGAIRTSLGGAGGCVTVSAYVFRTAGDRQPIASAHAIWRPASGATPVADERALRRAQTRAIRRALADVSDAPNGAFAGRLAGISRDPYADEPALRRVSVAVVPPALRERVADLDALIVAGVRRGLRAERAARWRRDLRALREATPEVLVGLDRAERRLRRWMSRGEPV
jgi:hypothetical protein